MQFLYPWVLWFSLLTFIPIIIHLFYFRRYKTEYFSNNDLLESIVKESRRQQKLRNLIILILRMFFIIFLVLAFAKPYIKDDTFKSEEPKNIYAIYIDNTFSMNDESKSNVSLLEEMKSKAIAFVQSLPNTTKYLLYYHGLNHNVDRIFSSDEIQTKISNIQISPITKLWSDIINIFRKLKEKYSTNISYVWFSDGQKYAVDYNKWEKESNEFYLFHSLPAKLNNISVDSVWFENPQHLIKQKEKIFIKITNHGTDDISSLPVKLYINDTLKYASTINILSNTSEIITFDFINTKAGWHNCKVEIPDFPVTFDNNYFFTYKVLNSINIAVVADNISPFINSFFKSDSNFIPVYYSFNKVTSSLLLNKQVIFLFNVKNISSMLWTEIINLVKKGTTLVFVPSKEIKLNEINDLLKNIGISYTTTDTSKINISISSYEQDFFKGMFTKKEERVNMPWVKVKYYIATYSNYPYDAILNYQNNEHSLIKLKFEKGKIFLFGFPIDESNTNFHLHPLFVSVFHRIFESSIVSNEISYTIQPNLSISIPVDTALGEKPIELKHTLTNKSFIPVQQYRLNEIVFSPINDELTDGHYKILHNNSLITMLAFNYSRKESISEFYQSDEILNILKSKGYKTKHFDTTDVSQLKKDISESYNGTFLWKLFLILALLSILSEMLIIKFWKIVK